MNDDEFEIRALMATYAVDGDRGRMDSLINCFALDGSLSFPGANVKGREEILTVLTSGERDPQLTRVRHHLTTSHINLVSKSVAKGRTYFLVISNIGPDHSGVYVDEFEKTDRSWLIKRRDVRIDWQSPSSLFRRFDQL